MQKEVFGVPIESFKEPIEYALDRYQNWSKGQISFDIDSAVNLAPAPEKPYSAISVSTVRNLGEAAANLYIYALSPLDGNGDFSTYLPGQIGTGVFPDFARFYPTKRDLIDTEVHMTIASQLIESEINPRLFAGHLSVLGVENGEIVDAGYLGQSEGFFNQYMKYRDAPQTATTTTGFKYWQDPSFKQGERFGDPQAIVNTTRDTVQVCGFIGITQAQASKRRSMLSSLRPDDFK